MNAMEWYSNMPLWGIKEKNITGVEGDLIFLLASRL
jgi:hypothetical protein